MSEPTQHFFESQRLQISYWTWGTPDAPPLLLVHGGRDHGRSWDRVAAAFEDEYYVVAPDLRGHGDSEWAIGSHYSIAGSVIDLVALADRLGAGVRVISHSFGGRVSLAAAAAFPELFEAIVAIEGAGLGVHHAVWDRKPGPAQMRKWIETARSLEGRHPKVYRSLEEARDRMVERNPRLEPEWALHLARHAVKPVEGGYVWKFDNWVHARTPFEMSYEVLQALWPAIECPVLHVVGADSDIGKALTDEDVTLFRHATRVVIPDAGHWVHHDQLDAVVREARAFFDTNAERHTEAAS